LGEEAAELRASRARRYEVERLARAGQPRGTLLERMLASTRPEPGQRQSPTQYIAAKAITTGSFALSGALLYGGVKVIGDMIRQAENLQRLFSQIEAQFESMGRGSEFSGFRRQILEIARDTGVAADQVATVGFQMRGAFEPTKKAIEETAGAIRVSLVTGIEQKELTDSLTAASIAYGTSIESIGDKAVGLEERFGVLSRESLKVFGDMASSAEQVGLSLDEMGAIVGVIQQRSARGGAAIAEGLGRVLPTIGQNAVEIARLYQQTGSLQPKSAQVLDQLAAGQTGKVLLQLVDDYKNLDTATQQYIITLLGGRREAQLLIPLFEGSAKVTKELARTEGDAGKVAERFANLQDTLSQRMKRFREEVNQLGDALFRAGLGDVLQGAADAGLVLVRVLGAILRLLGDVNDATGGTVGKFLLYAGAINLAARAMRTLRTATAAAGTANAATGALGYLGRAGAAPGAFFSGRAAAAGTAATNAGYAAAAGGAGRIGQTAAYGTGGALGALGINPYVVIAGSVAAVGVVTAQQRQTVRKAGEDLAKQLATATDARLKELLSQNEVDFWERITTAVSGTDTSEDAIKRELNKRNPKSTQLAETFRALDKYTGDPRTGYMTTIAKALEAGDPGEIKDAEEILRNLFKEDPNLQKQVEVALQRYRQDASDKAKADAAKPSFEKSRRSIQEIQAAFEAGEVGYDQLIGVQREQVEILQRLAAGDPEKLQQLLEARRALAKSQADNVASLLPILASLRQLAGQDPTANLPDIYGALDAQVIDDAAAPFVDPWEKIPTKPAIADPRQRVEQAQQAAQIQKDAFNKAIGREADAEKALALGRAGVKLDPRTKKVIEEGLSAIYGREIHIADTLKANEDELRDLTAKAIAQRVASVQLEGTRTNDPVKKAEAALKAARIAAYNPLATNAEHDNAVAAVLDAERALDLVIADKATAKAELVIARLSARGDEIGVARTRVEEAKRLLREAKPDVGQAALDRLQADVVTQEANLRDTTLSNRERDIDVALQLERISIAQAIQQLQALLSFPEITARQTEELLLKIKSLRDQAAGDFALNLGDIKLPTLYEVRRQAQSNAAGIGYQDNRNVAVTLYVTNGMTLDVATAMLSDALGAPVRTLTPRPRRY
jgi:hypothetical protein